MSVEQERREWRRKRDDWERLIEQVELGKLELAEAEAEAARLGVAPLAIRPDPNRFDPHKETHWTILMVLAWIMWRDVDQVREHWDSYREQFSGWYFETRRLPNGTVRAGYVLKSKDKATWLTLATSPADERVREPPLRSGAEAREELWRALEKGKVIATGRNSRSGEICAIPSVEWRWLSRPMSGPLHVQRSDSRDGYLDVVMERDIVVRLWRARKTTGRAQKICFERFCEAMKAFPTEKPKPKEEFIAEALDEIPALTRNAAEIAWARAVEATGAKAWSRPGRPQKNV